MKFLGRWILCMLRGGHAGHEGIHFFPEDKRYRFYCCQCGRKL